MAAAAGRRLDSIQAARAVAACGVVACHMLGYETKFLSGPPVASPAWQYGMAGVDLYFVISGYVITTMCIGRFGQPGAAHPAAARGAESIRRTGVWCLVVLAVFMRLASGFAAALAAGVASFHLIETPLLRVSQRLARVATAAPTR